jgi:hypothetical protein
MIKSEQINFLMEPVKPAAIVAFIGFVMSVVPSLTVSSVFFTWPHLVTSNYLVSSPMYPSSPDLVAKGAWLLWSLSLTELFPRFVLVPFCIIYLVLFTLNTIARFDFASLKRSINTH